MSNRERWIVYPLLFFTLGLALFDKLDVTGLAEFRSVQCNELHVVGENGIPLVSLSGSPDDTSGTVVVYEPIDIREANGDSTDGTAGGYRPNRRIELGAENGNGFVKVFGPGEVPVLRVGHDAQLRASGLVATDTQGALLTMDGLPEGSFWGNTVPWDAVTDVTREAADAIPDGDDSNHGLSDEASGGDVAEDTTEDTTEATAADEPGAP